MSALLNIKRKNKSIENNNIINVQSIKSYILKCKEMLNKKEISLNDYLNKIDIDDKNIKESLHLLLKNNQMKEFYESYAKFQFHLTLKDRLFFQNTFLLNKDLPDSIKKNIIKTESIKEIFKNICLNIIDDGTDNNIKEIFEKNCVYFKENINVTIPYKFGTKELKFYCLLNDIYLYFYSNKLSFDKKIKIFCYLRNLIISIEHLEDDEIILIFNYLINILHIYLDKKIIDKFIFSLIIKSCLPFNEEKANYTINLMKNIKENVFKINKKNICEYNKIEIKKDDLITFKLDKKEIEIKAEFINWNLNEDFYNFIDSDLFMICIRFPYNSKYNYFSIEEKIQNSLENLFNTMIKSDPVVQAMQNDPEAKKFEYIFYNKEILQEFAENTHLVIFPFSNYSGYIDKMSFDIYLDIYIKNDNDINMILSKFEVFLISKLHEYKHGTRIYMKIFNKSNLKTPNISFRSINISNRIKESSDIISKASINYPKNSILFKTSTNEYGESFEIALFGYKIEVLFLKSIIFCLKEKNWNCSSQDFYLKIKETMQDYKPIKLSEECNEGLPKLILEYFDFDGKNKLMSNILIENKSYNLTYNNDFHYVYIPRSSHHLTRDENSSDWR